MLTLIGAVLFFAVVAKLPAAAIAALCLCLFLALCVGVWRVFRLFRLC